MPVSRRQLFTATATVSWMMRGGGAWAQQPLAYIGSTRAEWDAVYPIIKSEGKRVHYAAGNNNPTTYYLLFDDADRARELVADYSGHPDGKIAISSLSEVGTTKFSQPDAFDLGGANHMLEYPMRFGYRLYSSPTFDTYDPGHRYFIAMDHYQWSSLYDLPSVGDGYLTTSIGRSLPEVNPIVPSGKELGPGASIDQWRSRYQIQEHQMGASILGLKPEGAWEQTRYQLSVRLAEPISTGEAAEVVGNHLQDFELNSDSIWIGPTPAREYGFRFHIFSQPVAGPNVTVQRVLGDEKTGTVDFIGWFPLWSSM